MPFSHLRQSLSNMSTPMKAIMVILLLVLLFSVTVFIQSVTQIRQRGMHPHNPFGIIFSGSRQPRAPSTLYDVDSIEGWMTFSYINFSFQLEKDYLRDVLGINSQKYPNISLQAYAKQKKMSRSIFLSEVKDAVRTVVSGESTISSGIVLP